MAIEEGSCSLKVELLANALVEAPTDEMASIELSRTSMSLLVLTLGILVTRL